MDIFELLGSDFELKIFKSTFGHICVVQVSDLHNNHVRKSFSDDELRHYNRNLLLESIKWCIDSIKEFYKEGPSE